MLTDVEVKHRRVLCPCHQRHTHQQLIYLHDQRARVVHPGGDIAAFQAGWQRYRTDVYQPPTLSSERIAHLRGVIRIHDHADDDPRRCLAPSCRDRYPCQYRRQAMAELLSHRIDVDIWCRR